MIRNILFRNDEEIPLKTGVCGEKAKTEVFRISLKPATVGRGKVCQNDQAVAAWQAQGGKPNP
jgi:hypothetical protein